MSKYVEPTGFTAKHTGKSGYVGVRPNPKPLPYGVIEEAGASFYPQYRDYIPKDARKYTDSYYDLRSKQYKYWYDKWGKPHINKWWRSQLKYEAVLRNAPWKKKNLRTTYTAQSKSNWKWTNKRYRSSTCYWTQLYSGRFKHVCKSKRRRQTYRNRKWSSYGKNYY